MPLKNAFDNLGTESALRRIANLLNFARDPADRIRVSVDAGAIVIYNRANSNSMQGFDSNSYNNATSWNVVDARDPLRQQLRYNANYTRQSRWTIN
jgi:hypothetical protein